MSTPTRNLVSSQEARVAHNLNFDLLRYTSCADKIYKPYLSTPPIIFHSLLNFIITMKNCKKILRSLNRTEFGKSMTRKHKETVKTATATTLFV